LALLLGGDVHDRNRVTGREQLRVRRLQSQQEG
jgi:hypothetical protein